MPSIKDILDRPSTWVYKTLEQGSGVHESVFRAYQLLEWVKSLLEGGVPGPVVLRLISEVEALHGLGAQDIDWKTPEPPVQIPMPMMAAETADYIDGISVKTLRATIKHWEEGSLHHECANIVDRLIRAASNLTAQRDALAEEVRRLRA